MRILQLRKNCFRDDMIQQIVRSIWVSKIKIDLAVYINSALGKKASKPASLAYGDGILRGNATPRP